MWIRPWHFSERMRPLLFGGHLNPVTLKPVSRIFCICGVFVSAFSAFSLRGISSNPCFSGVTSRFRKRGRQTGSRQSTPLSTIRTRCGNSVSTPGATRTGKNQQNSLQKGSRYGISVSTPHRRYGHRLWMPFFADAISETPMTGTFHIFRIFPVSGSNRWFRKSTDRLYYDRP